MSVTPAPARPEERLLAMGEVGGEGRGVGGRGDCDREPEHAIHIGNGGRGLHPRTRLTAACVVLWAALALCAGTAAADVSTLPANAPLPWLDPAHRSPLELLLAPLASAIAGRDVTVHCESGPTWGTAAAERGFDPATELGYVPFAYDSQTLAVTSVAGFAELSPTVCLALQRFAAAAPKPSPRRAHAYAAYAYALLTLAHEAVHLRGVVGLTLPDGRTAGEPDAEARANCEGLQRLPAVARGLGATPDEALAVARFAYARLYPLYRTGAPAYWSPECRRGGALDLRLAGGAIWAGTG